MGGDVLWEEKVQGSEGAHAAHTDRQGGSEIQTGSLEKYSGRARRGSPPSKVLNSFSSFSSEDPKAWAGLLHLARV